MTDPDLSFKIKIIKDGPYRVIGNIPLVKKSQHCSAYGEPLEWIDGGELEHNEGSYLLCRCGKSKIMPYCDNSHIDSGFVGDESAVTDGPFGRNLDFYGPDGLTVTKHSRLCMNSGFCVLKDTDFVELTHESDDPGNKTRVIKMVEDCPSGSLTYKLHQNGPDIEPELPIQIADTYECTQYGEIRGPLWVMGYIPIERSDGEALLPATVLRSVLAVIHASNPSVMGRTALCRKIACGKKLAMNRKPKNLRMPKIRKPILLRKKLKAFPTRLLRLSNT